LGKVISDSEEYTLLKEHEKFVMQDDESVQLLNDLKKVKHTIKVRSLY